MTSRSRLPNSIVSRYMSAHIRGATIAAAEADFED